MTEELGRLSARYESAAAGSKAIGWDSTGGASYGRFQIATKTGTMTKFIGFCSRRFPDLHARLSPVSGDMGSTKGAFARTWLELAEQGRTAEAEYEFVKATHYQALYDRLTPYARAMADRWGAIREVLWSTSVQHGGGDSTARGVSRAFNEDPAAMIRGIYGWRRTRFGSSTPAVRASVMRRFDHEVKDALAMLAKESTTPS